MAEILSQTWKFSTMLLGQVRGMKATLTLTVQAEKSAEAVVKLEAFCLVQVRFITLVTVLRCNIVSSLLKVVFFLLLSHSSTSVLNFMVVNKK